MRPIYGCPVKFWDSLTAPTATFPKILFPMVPSKRALVSFYRPSLVTFPLSLRVSEILLLLFSSMPLFPYPTSSLPKISPHSLGVGGSPFGYKEWRCWANCPYNKLASKISNLCDHKSPTSQTDGRHAIARPRFALKCIARLKRQTETELPPEACNAARPQWVVMSSIT